MTALGLTSVVLGGLAAGIRPWSDLPIWLPPGELHDSMHMLDTSNAEAAGLATRPLASTIRDTWQWLSEVGSPELRGDLTHGLDPAREASALSHGIDP